MEPSNPMPVCQPMHSQRHMKLIQSARGETQNIAAIKVENNLLLPSDNIKH
ncbi:hypothetical protein [Nitrosomonas sp.]|uniref:hypothetical protein n=1 Tax=Nitrosomonas sp. TaxID=42353 RepID=UPI001DED20AE|nr:hypothetical protein [Nitrosomonas sp.]MCB1947881.1 hypothetical protein [Nitrosomonas sp.]